jgi:hypothetical protein
MEYRLTNYHNGEVGSSLVDNFVPLSCQPLSISPIDHPGSTTSNLEILHIPDWAD